MTVVIINDFGYINGGASQVAIENALMIKKMGHHVIYFTAVGPIEEKLTMAGVEVICLKQVEFLNYPNKLKGAIKGIWNKTAFDELNNLLKKLDKKSTIIHVHVWIKALSCSIFKAIKRYRFNCIITAHDYFLVCPNGGFYNYTTGSLCQKKPLSLSCLFCNCDKRNYFQKLYRVVRQQVQNNILKNVNLHIIYVSEFSRRIITGALTSDFNSSLIRNKINPIPKIMAGNPCFYLYIGRLSPEKGPDIFCEAISKLKLRGTVIGDGEMKGMLIKKYPEIRFTGWLNHYDMAKYVANAKALIVTSRCYETAVLTIPEIQYNYDVPVIVGDQCAGCEYVINGENGYIFKSEDFNSLLDAIKYIEIAPLKNLKLLHCDTACEDEIFSLYMKILYCKKEENHELV